MPGSIGLAGLYSLGMILYEMLTGRVSFVPGIIVAVQTFGDRINFHPRLLYANSHRGKVRKANTAPVALGMIEEEPPLYPVLFWSQLDGR